VQRIPQRDLRNHVSAVLRRVMGGETIRVTVGGRDAADLVPIEERATWTSGERARQAIETAQADPELGRALRAAFPDTTDVI